MSSLVVATITYRGVTYVATWHKATERIHVEVDGKPDGRPSQSMPNALRRIATRCEKQDDEAAMAAALDVACVPVDAPNAALPFWEEAPGQRVGGAANVTYETSRTFTPKEGAYTATDAPWKYCRKCGHGPLVAHGASLISGRCQNCGFAGGVL